MARFMFSKPNSFYTLFAFLFMASFSGFSLSAAETKMLALVSDRSAASMVTGAHQFLSTSKESTTSIASELAKAELTRPVKSNITIRSVSQLNQLSNSELQQLIIQHQGIIVAGVFGESVERLLAMQYPTTQTRLILSSDRRLMALHQDVQGGKAANLSSKQLQQLMTRFDKNDYLNELANQQKQWPQFSYWLQARGYWQNRGKENLGELFHWLQTISASQATELNQAGIIIPLQPIRFYWQEQLISLAALKNNLVQTNAVINGADANKATKPIVFIVDHDTGDQPGQWQLHQQLCQQQWQCVSVLAGWGVPSEQAIEDILDLTSNLHLNLTSTSTSTSASTSQPFAIIALQDFVIGGGEGRESVTEKFKALNVPIFKGIRVTELSELAYQLSPTGLPSDSVHYRVAMPELQGVSQPHVLALASNSKIDSATGARLSISQVLTDEVARLQARVDGWLALKTKANSDKKIAIVYYNHPPGRHNIGADNLDVQQSLWQILKKLKAEGYYLGPESEFPKSADELLDILQLKAVNLPQDAGELAKMSSLINAMSASDYQAYFDTLPTMVQAEMIDGPLGYLDARVRFYLAGQGQTQLAQLPAIERKAVLEALLDNVENTSVDLHHALDGIRHKGRIRALDLLEQLTQEYRDIIALSLANNAISASHWQNAESLKTALIDMQIEGIRGWGKVPGNTMVWNNEILLPGVQFGNIFLGPQPPRGWELNEELLHANMTFPPPHQYLAFYYYLRDVFKANAIVHLGRHSTYEFLPKRAVGLSASDYPSLIIESVPSIYPYIVDGVGEGIQAKRRGIAVMLDHLTPPLATTELYDGLLQLRQLIESAEAASNQDTKKKAIKALRHKIEVLNLTDELVASMDEELQVRGIGFGEVDDDFLLHEVGHYLTHLQEDFMPLGLHVYGKGWNQEAIDTMMESIEKGELDFDDLVSEEQTRNIIQQNLIISPSSEMSALLNALNGGFIAPGKGNDPIRTPDALPTGRNFYALDGSLIPSQLGFNTGQQLASKARAENPIIDKNHKEAVILWASDAVRDEGAMIAFGMDMLGVKPVWNRRGILKSLELIPLDETRSERRDIVFTTSGLFRDLYAQQLAWLDRSVLLALAASKNVIERDHPALIPALYAALKPIEAMLEQQTITLDESLTTNMVASNWLREAQALLRANKDISPEVLGRQASYRIFGTAPGAYGAGINRLAERSGAWQERKQLGEAYIKRMSHAYGVPSDDVEMGSNVQSLFRQQLAHVNSTYLGRASNLYGLIDNNDAYDYLGGLNLAIETITGEQPESFVISHANNKQLSIDPLQLALLSELRGRFLNRQWIQPLMKQGYAGARTMGNEFIENLWGWQATSPEIIKSWVWEDLKAVYIDDSLDIGLDEFLQENHNVHVQSNILAIMLVAIEKGFWQASEQTQTELAEKFAKNIVENGIPGSGHTHANHPIYNFITPMLSAELNNQLAEVLAAANHTPTGDSGSGVKHIQEISTELEQAEAKQAKQENEQSEQSSEQQAEQQSAQEKQYLLIGVIVVIVLIVLSGYIRSRRQLAQLNQLSQPSSAQSNKSEF
ncbi:cobaltochelatase subunit CobN [Colwellia echini]|uniref:Cobaltochelatase subunit CobN n=1 Tax=Colwellia echini TaxID=1982103 RepID=A0ABY3MY96_9GAMM|nr:cobaltochelatase subunit CobN [Colwellia echini]TYK65977.1 cobaltochelatase subunit CobN [Colwellia echini]